ncbi:MAG: helix-turn-helix transcriptional regulator [Vulcanimicrobiota bacterium]
MDPKNKIKSLRLRKGLTQTALAKAVGVSQQQIHRFENGISIVKLETAVAIAAALGKTVDAVFPGLSKAYKALRDGMISTGRPPSTDQYQAIRRKGVEADPTDLTIRLLLNGHSEPHIFPISHHDKERLHHILFQGFEYEENGFFVFNSEQHQVAFSLAEVAYCHFLFDIGCSLEREEPSWLASAYFRGSQIEHTFEIEPDFQSEDEEDMGQLASVFWYLELPPESGQHVHFIDGDGEEVFLQARNLALFMVPLSCLHAEPYEDEDDDEE